MWRTITFTGLALFQIIAAEDFDRDEMNRQLNCEIRARTAVIIENNGNPQLVSCFKTELAKFGNKLEKYRNKTVLIDRDLELIDYIYYHSNTYSIDRSGLKHHVCRSVERGNNTYQYDPSPHFEYNKENFIKVIKQLNKIMWIRFRERILGEYDEIILNLEVLEALCIERIRVCSTELGLEKCAESTLLWVEDELQKYVDRLTDLKGRLVSFENGSDLDKLSAEILDSSKRLASILTFCKRRKYCCRNRENPIVVMSCIKEFGKLDC